MDVNLYMGLGWGLRNFFCNVICIELILQYFHFSRDSLNKYVDGQLV